ncbi:MAG TPA: methyltransferase domain-containing protein [Polyangiaceae bacterium]|jgi:SAM-dependent methyltransferase|nr:methyltransferase domain-containing protein [Polyangiaceae bacterium]
MAGPPKQNDATEWTNIAAAYEEVNEPFMGLWAEEAIRLAGLGPTDRVLDVATGPGTLAVRAAPLVKEVVATDYADGMLARLRARIERDKIANISVKQMNGQQLELASESFDAAFSVFGLIFFPDRGRGFRELCRVIKPEGRAVVVGWGPLEKMPLIDAMIRGLREAMPDLPAPSGTPPVQSLQDPARFATEMMEAGFDDVEIITRTIEKPTGETAEQFFDRAAPANLFVAPLKAKLPKEKWEDVRGHVCKAIRATLGEGPVVYSAEANIGVGRRGADEEE